jgi:ATP-dependent protease HslVU (ClpYQ) ATPase subunit
VRTLLRGEIGYVGKETDRKWEEGDEISILEFKTTEYGRSKKVIASEEIKKKILDIGINKCARESGFDRKNFIRKLIRGIPVKRNSYQEFMRWLQSSKLA